VGTGVLVAVRVGTGVLVAVLVGTGVFVAVRVGTGVLVAVRVGTGVFVEVFVGATVFVAVTVAVGILVEVAVGGRVVGVAEILFVAVFIGTRVIHSPEGNTELAPADELPLGDANPLPCVKYTVHAIAKTEMVNQRDFFNILTSKYE
jgi:hypothetical protein